MRDATSEERVRAALSYLSHSDRLVWVRQAMAIKSEFGEDGFAIWDDWGARSDTHNASDAKSVWKSVKPGGKTTIASLFYDAKQAGWKDDSTYKKPSAAEIEQRRKLRAERDAQAAAQEAAQHEAVAVRAKALWDAAAPCADEGHAYLVRKGVKAHGLRYGNFEIERVDDETGEVTVVVVKALLMPVMDRQRKIWSLQAFSAKPDGAKLLLKNARKSGNFYVIGAKPLQHQGRPVFVLAEGFATGASTHEATGHLVMVCIDAGNLRNVARILRERTPDAIIIIAADNDTETPGNPGLTAARRCAEESGCLVAFPPDGGDFNDLAVMGDGPEAVAAVIGAVLAPAPVPPEPPVAPPPPDPEPEPERAIPEDNSGDEYDDIDASAHFTVLGYDRAVFYFFVHSHRQIVAFKPGELSEANLIMMAPLDWWELSFPGDKGGMKRSRVLDWLFRLGALRGIFDNSRLRGRGAWDDDGRVVYHQGSSLYVDGVQTDVTRIKSKFIYELAKTQAVPAGTPLSDADGTMLLETSKMFRWSKPGAAALLAGWTFLSPVCGAIKWRPHIWLTGGAGTGKSTILNQYISTCLGDAKVFAQGNSTEAGLRQKLKADAIPVLFDESEQNDEGEKRRMAPILALIRQASTESVAQTYKGTISGDSMNFHVRSMFCLASIQVGMDNKADEDRLTKLSLLKPPKDDTAAQTWATIQERLYVIGRDRSLPGRMLRRAIDMLPVIQQNITVFVEAAAKRFKSQRQGDQYGTMLAGAWSLCNSAVATTEQAWAMIEDYDWDEFIDGSDVEDSEKALQAVMEAKVSQKGESISIGSIVSVAAGRAVSGLVLETDVAARILRESGMKIVGSELVFRNNSTALKALVQGSRFEADLKGQLLRLKGASVTKKAVRFGSGGGDVQRGVSVPLALILGGDDEGPPI